MNKPMRKIAAALGVLLAAMFLNLNFVQVVKGSSYRNNPNNQRVLLNEYSHPRGQIVVQGIAVATSKETTDELKYLRQYPEGPVYAPVTGFYSFIYGSPDGIENTENAVLSGTDSRLVGRQLSDLLTGRNPQGGSVQLTINNAAQQAAYKAMAGANGKLRAGAVVALDPQTGAILAMVSTPSYDPNQLSSHDADAITSYYQKENADPSDPLANRAINETYPPGSTFKIVVTAAALQAGYQSSQTVPAPNSYWPLDPTDKSACPASLSAPCVENFNGETCDNGTTATLVYAFAKSCNTAFAELGVKLGGSAINDQAKAFGINGAQLSIPMGVATSTVDGGDPSVLTDPAALAQTSFGQRNVRLTPLQDAMLAAAVADGGTVMKPYLVQKELAPNLSTLSQTSPTTLSQAMTPTVAQVLQQMMVQVVTAPEGTGGAAAVPGYTVGGKTGTADTGETSGSGAIPDAWFTGFALQGSTPKIAVAVLLENGGVNGDESAGGKAAAPVAQAVMAAYLKSIS